MPICFDCARLKMRGFSTITNCESCAGMIKIPMHEVVKNAIKNYSEEHNFRDICEKSKRIDSAVDLAIARNDRMQYMRKMCRRDKALRK